MLMAIRRILVTGGNRGIGFAICKDILRENESNVAIIGCRNPKNGQDAVDALLKENPLWADRVEMLQIDVDNVESVNAAAEKLSQKGKLYGVVNNAGILAKSPSEVIHTNVMGVKHVCDAFIPLIQKDGRIVMISSGAASNFLQKCSPERIKQFTSDDITLSQINSLLEEFNAAGTETETVGMTPWDADWTPYGFSKAMLNAYTILLAREHPDITVAACSPGMIRTDLFTQYAANRAVTIDESISAFGAKDPSESTVAPLRLLFSNEIKTGLYYGSDGLRSPFAKYRSPGSQEYDGHDGR